MNKSTEALLRTALRRSACRSSGRHLFFLSSVSSKAVEKLLSELREQTFARDDVGFVIGDDSCAIRQIARSLAAELGRLNVRFNAIALHEKAQIEDVVAVVDFLNSGYASYITGVTIKIGPRPGWGLAE